MVSFKATHAQEYETQFNSRLRKSTFINDFINALQHFPEMDFKEILKEQIIKFDKQLDMLNELGKQLSQFNTQHSNIAKLTTAIDKSFENYDKQTEKNKSELLHAFLKYYLKEQNDFTIALFKNRLPLQMAQLGIEGNANDRLDSCIQLIKNHFSPKDAAYNRLKIVLEIIKNSQLNEGELNLSEFIFEAHKQALLLLQEKIKKNLSDDVNIEKVKTDCDNLPLFLNFYQESIINLVSYYQNYNNKIEDIKNKLDFLEVNVGGPIKDWLDNYRQLSDSLSSLTAITQQNLQSKYDDLSQFKKQLKMDNPTEFLHEVKSKIQKFLDNEIEILNQQFQDYQTTLITLARSFSVPQCELIKLLQIKQLQCFDIQKTWLARKERLKLINELDDLKNFNRHFSEEKLFISDSLDLEKMALHSAFILLDSNPINKNENLIRVLSQISIQNLANKIFLILEHRDVNQLPHSINNLLQFINSESKHAIINESKNYLTHSLKNFFTSQNERAAFCLVQALDDQPLALTIKSETYQNLLNYLRLIDLTELKKWSKSNLSLREKIKKSYKHDIKPYEIDQSIDKLISTKKFINLFEGKKNDTSTFSLWDACLLFQEFSGSFQKRAFPFLKGANNTSNALYDFQEAVENLNVLIRMLMKLEKRTYSSTLFLKTDKEKQKHINELIQDLKNTPITHVDKDYINAFFETWKNNNKQIINEPRYRFLISLFMLIYRRIMEIVSSSTFETKSYQTVNELQKLFSDSCETLEKLKSHFNPFCPALIENSAVESKQSLAKLR